MQDKLDVMDALSTSLRRGSGLDEAVTVHGKFIAELVRNERVIWHDEGLNVVTTVGKNVALDGYLASGYSLVGPYMGLIGASTTGPVVGDTMASHGGWSEAGNANTPTYTSPRKTCAWNAASAGSKSLSAALSFAITGTGTVNGAFIVFGTGALTTIDNTAGTLYSAGTFTGRSVLSGDTLNVSYTASL